MSVYKFTNPHPKGLKTNDCVVRAMSLAFNEDYLETRRKLNEYKRFLNLDSYKSNSFIYQYLEIYERLIIPPIKGKPRMRAADFVEAYGDGTYIVKMAKHLACIKDGKLLDTWDSGDKAIYTAWRIE